MSVEKAMAQRLLNDGALKALVQDRIFPVVLPQGTDMPAISWWFVDDSRDEALDGPTGLANPRVQINSWSTDYLEAKAVARAVETALVGMLGSFDDVEIDGVQLETAQDSYDHDTKLNFIASDFTINYRFV